MRPEQHALEESVARLARSDESLGIALEEYRKAARTLPFGISHFGLRYASEETLLAAAERVSATLAPKLGERLNLRVFDPRDGERSGATVIQAFLYQDVIVSGSFNYGQLIELQSQPL
jgi:hypothetical protein